MPRLAATASDLQLDDPAQREMPRPLASAKGARHGGKVVTIKLSRLFAFLWLAAIVIVLVSLSQDLLIFLAPEAGLSDRIYRLDLDAESSLPTWFAASLLLLCALSLLFVALQVDQGGRRKAIPWFLLAVIFAALSLDEIAMLHEWLSTVLSARMENTGLFYFAWTLPALVVCLAGLVCFVPFIFSFKGLDRGLLIGSAVVFLLGAIGMEMLGGAQAERAGIDSLHYRLFATIEESLEYAGVLLFLWFILRQLRASHNETALRFE